MSVALVDIEWSPDAWTVTADTNVAMDVFQDELSRVLKEAKDAGMERIEPILCFTGADNFRNTILPSYKGHRKRKPPGYSSFRDRLVGDTTYQTVRKHSLEADDCLGILATKPDQKKRRRVIWSGDKDLLQVPGEHLRNGEIIAVTKEAGDRWHAIQTLAGDSTDGYYGVPGFGPVKARNLVDSHMKEGMPAVWAAVQAAYEKAGLTAEDALIQARVAKILQAPDYDFKNKKVKLWYFPKRNLS